MPGGRWASLAADAWELASRNDQGRWHPRCKALRGLDPYYGSPDHLENGGSTSAPLDEALDVVTSVSDGKFLQFGRLLLFAIVFRDVEHIASVPR